MASERDFFSVIEERDSFFTDHSLSARSATTPGFQPSLVSDTEDLFVAKIKTSASNGEVLSDRDHILANMVGGAFTLNLPAAPVLGTRIRISDYQDAVTGGGMGTNNLTVGRNGLLIDGDADDFIMDQDGADAEFVYVDVSQGWRVLVYG